ncbi:hypothetical protein D1872_258670 [compost metagenome]
MLGKRLDQFEAFLFHDPADQFMDFGIIYRFGQIVGFPRLAQTQFQLQIHVITGTQLALFLEHTVISVKFHAPYNHFIHHFSSSRYNQGQAYIIASHIRAVRLISFTSCTRTIWQP